MGYCLGVDMGTTYTAAAVWRDGTVEVASLGNRAPVVPSMVAVSAGGEVLVGEPAARRAATDPLRVAREFKRRIGDPTPVIVGGSPYSADALVALLLRWVVDRVSETQGQAPSAIAVAHPANWGEYKKDLLRQAIARAGLDDVALVTEPEAAAIHYASQERVEPGSVVAVYDLGGGTFDVAVLRKTEGSWEILGEPEGIERLGGIDLDEAVFRHVAAATDDAIVTLDPDDRGAQVALARLRSDCVEAKEALSSDTAVSIPVTLAGSHRDVRLTRAEFEDMVRAPLTGTITALGRALRSARVTPAEVDAVLLVGGSSRVPLVGQLVGAELGRPVAIDAHPKYGVALGAATVAAEHHATRTTEAHQADAPAGDRAPVAAGPDVGEPPAPVPIPQGPPGARRARGPVWLTVGALSAVAVVASAFFLRDPGDDPAGGGETTTTTAGMAPGGAEVPDFDADFVGSVGEGQELIDWLLDHEGQAVHLDLSFSDPPDETDSPPFWTNCEGLPAAEQPSTAFCDAWVLHVLGDDTTDPPFPESRDLYHLEGYFLVGTRSGPNQGYYSIPVEPVSAQDALG